MLLSLSNWGQWIVTLSEQSTDVVWMKGDNQGVFLSGTWRRA